MYENQANAAQVQGNYVNGGVQSAGYSTILSVAATMPLDELAKRLDVARERTTQATTRIRAIADSLFGPEPEQKQNSGATLQPPPNGRVASLSSQADGVHYWLAELERQIGRLSPLG